MHLRFFDFFGFIVSQFSFRRQKKRKNLKKINLKNSGEKSVEAGNSKAKMLFDFTEKAAHCQKPNFLNGVESIFMFQRDHTQNCQYFGEKEAKRPQSRRFSPNSFWPKAGPNFRLTAKTELGKGRNRRLIFSKKKSEQRRLQSPEGAGVPEKACFFGEKEE